MQVGVDPLAVALPWIQFGFVGLLDVGEVLNLWDRVLGYQMYLGAALKDLP